MLVCCEGGVRYAFLSFLCVSRGEGHLVLLGSEGGVRIAFLSFLCVSRGEGSLSAVCCEGDPFSTVR